MHKTREQSKCWHWGSHCTTEHSSRLTSLSGAPLIKANGEAHPNAAAEDGAMCSRGRADKERKYAELLTGDRCRLVVVALETGGRWSNEAIQFIDDLAAARAREAPPVMRRSAFLAWKRRWSRMIGISCARAFANSLAAVATAPHTLAGVDGEISGGGG